MKRIFEQKKILVGIICVLFIAVQAQEESTNKNENDNIENNLNNNEHKKGTILSEKSSEDVKDEPILNQDDKMINEKPTAFENENVATVEEKPEEVPFIPEGFLDEKDDDIKPLHLNLVKVVQDNVSGDKASSFSENQNADREDESTSSDIKKDAEKRIIEKEKQADIDEQTELNKQKVQEQQQQENEKQQKLKQQQQKEKQRQQDWENQNKQEHDRIQRQKEQEHLESQKQQEQEQLQKQQEQEQLQRQEEQEQLQKQQEQKQLQRQKVQEQLQKEQEQEQLQKHQEQGQLQKQQEQEQLESQSQQEQEQLQKQQEQEQLESQSQQEQEQLQKQQEQKQLESQKRQEQEQLESQKQHKREQEQLKHEQKLKHEQLQKQQEQKQEREQIAKLKQEQKQKQEQQRKMQQEQKNQQQEQKTNNQQNDPTEAHMSEEQMKTGDSQPKTMPKDTVEVPQHQKETDTLNKEVIPTISTPVDTLKQAEVVDVGEQLYIEAMELLKHGKKDMRRAYKLLASSGELNYTKAWEEIAYPYLLGDYIKRNISLAVDLFHRMAEKGMPAGQQGLGFVYGAGLHVNSSQAKALIYTTFGALGEDTLAQMMLGYRYFTGIGVQQNCESALTYYKKVAKKVSNETKSHGGNAVQRVRLYDELEQPGGTAGQIDEDLLQYYQFLADKGDVQAQVGLGQLYYQGGRGVDIDYEKAFKYFNLAAEAGNGNGLAYLGKMYLESFHVDKDIDKAYKYFKKSADDGNPIGQAGLGMLYLKGDGVKQDYDKAMKHFSEAAEQGWVEGQLQLGNMYYHGLGIKKDFRQAVKYFTFASQSGHVLAFYNLASMHAIGAGVMRSCQTATELFKNVAERGKWSTMFMDAYDAYKAGDLEKALLKYYLLAELGYEVAQSNVAYILDKGDVEMFSANQTYARALLQWSRAAHQGYTVARVKLGDYHYYGLGTNVDYEAAALNYRIASDQQSNPQAMFNLGYMHEQGFGLKKDIHLAKRFYDMAAEASPDAQFPVYMALMKLAFHFSLEWLQMNYRFWDRFDTDQVWVKTVQYLGPEWDVYIISLLAGLLVILLLFRRAMTN